MICERNIGTSPGELRDVRQDIIRQQTGPAKGPLDLDCFYYMSGFRDLLCHAHGGFLPSSRAKGPFWKTRD